MFYVVNTLLYHEAFRIVSKYPVFLSATTNSDLLLQKDFFISEKQLFTLHITFNVSAQQKEIVTIKSGWLFSSVV